MMREMRTKKTSTHSTHMKMMMMMKWRTCNPKRKISKHRGLVLVLRYMVTGIRRETLNLKLYLRVKKLRKSSKRGYFKPLCLMLSMKKNLK
jgi:hypothetical protein